VENLRRTRLLIGSCALVAAFGLCGTVSAMPVNGTSGVIEFGDDIYIPLQQETSGILGELLGSGPYQHVVGLDPDSVTLSALNPSTSGNVTMVANFDISDEFTEQMGEVDPNSDMPLLLVFADLDFSPVVELGGDLAFSESLQIVLMDADRQAVAGAAPILLNGSNYLNYRQDVDAQGQQVVPTNNVTGTYEIAISQMFGPDSAARTAFIDSLNETEAFSLMLTFQATVDYSGSRRVRYHNTPEALDGSSVVFNVAPEPGSIALLAAGAALLFRRKRRTRP